MLFESSHLQLVIHLHWRAMVRRNHHKFTAWGGPTQRLSHSTAATCSNNLYSPWLMCCAEKPQQRWWKEQMIMITAMRASHLHREREHFSTIWPPGKCSSRPQLSIHHSYHNLLQSSTQHHSSPCGIEASKLLWCWWLDFALYGRHTRICRRLQGGNHVQYASGRHVFGRWAAACRGWWVEDHDDDSLSLFTLL